MIRNYTKLLEFFSNDELKKKKPDEVKYMVERIELANRVLSNEQVSQTINQAIDKSYRYACLFLIRNELNLTTISLMLGTSQLFESDQSQELLELDH